MFRWKIGKKFPQINFSPWSENFSSSFSRKTTETTVALSGAVYKLDHHRERRARKKRTKNSKNISLNFSHSPSLSPSLRSEKFLQTRLFFNPFFSRISRFYLFSSHRAKRRKLRELWEEEAITHVFVCWLMEAAIERAREEKKDKKENSPEICLETLLVKKNENGFSCVERKRERERIRRIFSQLLLQLIIFFH